MRFGLESINAICNALVYPSYCKGCHNSWEHESGILCDACIAGLSRFTGRNRALLKNLDDELYVFYAYDELLRFLIHQLKFQGRPDVAKFLAKESFQLFAEVVRIHKPETIVPVPLHKARIRERGYNQCQIIAEYFSAYSSVSVTNDVLIRVKNTKPQSRLSTTERSGNIQQAFRMTGVGVDKIKEPIVLLDDVIHTGSTVRSCIDTLKSAGLREIIVFAVSG